jgi:hypothetical protein
MGRITRPIKKQNSALPRWGGCPSTGRSSRLHSRASFSSLVALDLVRRAVLPVSRLHGQLDHQRFVAQLNAVLGAVYTDSTANAGQAALGNLHSNAVRVLQVRRSNTLRPAC